MYVYRQCPECVVLIANLRDPAFASIQSDIFKPTKYGGKYTVTLIPGMPDPLLHT